MICPNCKSEVTRITNRYIDAKLVQNCISCETKISHYPIYDSTNGYTISVAHRNDIKRRTCNPDGSVTRR